MELEDKDLMRKQAALFHITKIQNTRKNTKNGQEKGTRVNIKNGQEKTYDLCNSCYKKSVCTYPLSIEKRLEKFTVKLNIHFSMCRESESKNGKVMNLSLKM
jgi:hypothetical protein